MPTAPTPFDWRSLIPSAVALGSKAIGDRIAPNSDQALIQQRDRQLAEEKRQFDVKQGFDASKLAQANAIRGSVMPGMYTALGYDPSAARNMAAQYMQVANRPPSLGSGGAPGTTYTPGSTQQQGGSTGGRPGIGKTIASVGLGMAPVVAGALLKGAGTAAGTAGGAAAGGGLGGTIAGLATNPFTIAGAGALTAGLLWKKSQAHPTADKWVQGEQNPFDQSMAHIDQAVQAGHMSGEEAQQAKMQNAQNYLNELSRFASMGGHNREVANNALQTFRQYYGDPMKYGMQLGGF